MPPLTNVNWSAFPECFLLTMQIHDWLNGANRGLSIVGGDLDARTYCYTVSMHICLGI